MKKESTSNLNEKIKEEAEFYDDWDKVYMLIKEFIRKIEGKQKVMTLPDGEQILAVEMDEIDKLSGKNLSGDL